VLKTPHHIHHLKMYSDRRTNIQRGYKRKLTEEDEPHIRPRIKYKADEERSEPIDDLNDKENNELKIDFLRHTTTVDEDEFNNNISDILNSTGYDDLNNETDKESNRIDSNQNETFNTFLNSSLTQCYTNSRPLTPIPPQISNNPTGGQLVDECCSSPIVEPQQTVTNQRTNANSTNQPQSSSSPNLSSFNSFPIALISNTKLFNSTSSSLINAASIVDTYFSSTTKKSKLEKAKNMNHFRYSLFNKSLTKLNKFCNSSDPNIRNSVLVCNTLKRLERQLRKENIYLHLTANGLAFIKLKNKRSTVEQLDYRNLVLDETSQLYVEKDTNNDESEEEDEEENNTDENDEFGIDTDFDFKAANANDSNSSCSSESESDDLDEEDDELSNKFNGNEASVYSNEQSNDFIEPSAAMSNSRSELSTYLAPTETADSALVNNFNLTVSDEAITNTTNPSEWTDESNQFNWTNMFTNLTLCREGEQFALNEQSKDELDSSYLFNSIEQSATVCESSTSDELFSDIDSLISLYDFDPLTSVSNNNSTKTNEQSIEQDDHRFDETKSSTSSEDSDTTFFTLDRSNLLDSAIGSINSSLSINPSSLPSSSNNSINNSSPTSCSTSASVNSSSTSFASSQGNAISPVIS